MKKIVCSLMLVGATVFSFTAMLFLGCGSPDKIGQGGGGGGVAGTVTIKLDANPSGNGASGGSGGSGSTPTGDANCGSTTSNTTRQPPDVMLLLDRSSSMYYTIDQDCFCTDADATASGIATGTTYTLCTNTTNCQTRWSAVQPAVIDTVTNSTDVNWGLKFFPSATAAQCTVSSTMEVPIGSSTAAAITTQVQNTTFSLSTPTTLALNAVTAYLKTLTDSRPKFILLATDGQPNCAGGQIMNTDVPGAVAAAQAAYNAGFPVYVVGIGPSLSNLTQIASAGGTKDYYPVSSPQELVDAFAAIETLVQSCTFTLSLASGADLNNVAVYLDKNLVQKDSANGWSFGGGNQTVILNGSSCDKVTSGKASTVEVLIGCAGQLPPPTIP